MNELVLYVMRVRMSDEAGSVRYWVVDKDGNRQTSIRARGFLAAAQKWIAQHGEDAENGDRIRVCTFKGIMRPSEAAMTIADLQMKN